MIEEQIVIDAPPARVYETFAGLEHWERALPDVVKVETLYDDGLHQEFLMTVERESQHETVRGIRYLEPNSRIELFQPVPPPKFRSMCGVWHFEADGDATRVRTTRTFTLRDEHAAAADAVANGLRGYLRTNLGLFKAYIEKADG
jgi:ribosome-associated toxin RatA of RatAB toxin-antitoxin module